MKNRSSRVLVLGAASVLVLSACGRHHKEASEADAVVTPPPNLPAWAAPMLGKPLSKFFQTSTACKGHFDVTAGRVVSPPSVQAAGWAWDTAAGKPVDRVLFTDDGSIIIGAGVGGTVRPDVPAALPDVTSQNTGWSGALGRADGKASALALVSGGKACAVGDFDLAAQS